MLDGLRLGLVGLHVPSAQPRRQQAPAGFHTAVTSALGRPAEIFPDMPVVVAGDLAVSGDAQGYDDPFHAAGLTDAYRHLHGSPPGPRGASPAEAAPGVGRVFVTAQDASHVVACAYDQRPVAEQLSVHPAMTLLLRLPSRAHDPAQGPSTSRSPTPTAGEPAAPATRAGTPQPRLTTPTEDR
jgi:exodeoxyribonuclease-3